MGRSEMAAAAVAWTQGSKEQLMLLSPETLAL